MHLPFWDRKRTSIFGIEKKLSILGPKNDPVRYNALVTPRMSRSSSKHVGRWPEIRFLWFLNEIFEFQYFFVMYRRDLGSKRCFSRKNGLGQDRAGRRCQIYHWVSAMTYEACWDDNWLLKSISCVSGEYYISILGSKTAQNGSYNFQNLKLKITFQKTTPYCASWYLWLVEVILEYQASIISSFPTP